MPVVAYLSGACAASLPPSEEPVAFVGGGADSGSGVGGGGDSGTADGGDGAASAVDGATDAADGAGDAPADGADGV